MTRAAASSEFTFELRQQQFGALLKLSPQAIAVLDSDGRIREWNPAAVALLGWTREEVLGRRIQTLAPAPHRGELKRLWTELRASHQTGAVQCSHLRRDGVDSAVEVYMAPIQDVDGSFAGAVATLSGQDFPDHDATLGSANGPGATRRGGDGPSLTALERDDVTGLPGRRWLQQRMTAPVPEGVERAVALLDVDAFALVNQGYGPEAGDEVLRGLAERLAQVAGQRVVGPLAGR
jgi:PAS domain S-box-containing protein